MYKLLKASLWGFNPNITCLVPHHALLDLREGLREIRGVVRTEGAEGD